MGYLTYRDYFVGNVFVYVVPLYIVGIYGTKSKVTFTY